MIKVALSVPIHNLIHREFSLEELFAFAKEARFDGIEYLASFRDLVKRPKHILNLSNKYNVAIVSVHQPIYSIFYTPSWLALRMITLLDFFPETKITNQHLSAFLNPSGSNISAVEIFVKRLGEKGIQASYESNPGRFYLSKRFPKETYDFLAFEQFSKKHNLPITLDTSHIANVGGDIVAFFQRNHSRIKLIHLSDYHNGKEHLPLGTGSLPIKEFLQTIKKSKWNGQITFEIGNLKHLQTKKEKLAAIENSLRFVRKYL